MRIEVMGQSQISIDILCFNVSIAGWDDIYIYIPIKMATDEVVLRLSKAYPVHLGRCSITHHGGLRGNSSAVQSS